MDLLSRLSPQVVVFYALALATVLSAMGVALARNILYSAFSLLGTLAGVAGLYLYLGADFVGVTQILVYIGGILVLILFAVLLTNRIADVRVSNLSAGVLVTAPAALAVLGLLVRMTTRTAWPRVAQPVVAPTTARLGDAFLGEYALPFELASVILLTALVGAMVIARRAVGDEAKDTDLRHDRLV
jgi:NADH-quinone oxidoreductase subunit J